MARLAAFKAIMKTKTGDGVEYNSGVYFNDVPYSLEPFTSQKYSWKENPTDQQVEGFVSQISSVLKDDTFWYSLPVVTFWCVKSNDYKGIFKIFPNCNEMGHSLDYKYSYKGDTLIAKAIVSTSPEMVAYGDRDTWKYGTPVYQRESASLEQEIITIPIFPESYVKNGKIEFPDVSSCEICLLSLYFGYRPNQAYFSLSKVNIPINSNTRSYWLSLNGENTIGSNDDPFNPGGNTGSGGGGGSFDNTSTPIDIPGLPSISAASTGFISLFNPSLSQLNDLASYLWSDLFEINGWKKLFADPMDAILGLSILPVAIPSGGTREVKVGNIGTGKSLTVAASQFVEVDCGTIDVNEYWGAYLDYEPYTQAQIFLPYIGTRPISVDEIMGKTVRVAYHVDILTGACCAFVKCGDSVLYTYNGQCSIPIPITGANYTSVVNGVISVAASVGSLVATGGASAPTAVPAIASSVVNQMKPQIEKSGSISGSAGVLNMQTPYLILIRPRQALPSKQNEFIGYPSLITVQLTELTGYTEVQSIHLENIPATQEELAEIQSLLEGGVIF